jgi:hypothetical protein
MSSHIKMGFYGALRDYALLDPKNYTASLANPFAANINTESQYGAYDLYNDWTAEDWRAGVGKRKVQDGGCLFSHMDTRFPNQMILPMGIDWPVYYPCPSNRADYATGDLTVDGTTITKITASFTSPSTSETLATAWVYIDIAGGSIVTMNLLADVASNPGSSVASGTFTTSKLHPGPQWIQVVVGSTALSTNTRYHLQVSANASFTVPLVNMRAGEVAFHYTAGAWVGRSTSFQFVSSYSSDSNNLGLTDGSGSVLMENGDEFDIVSTVTRTSHFAKTRGRLFGATGNTMYEIRTGTDTITTIFTTTAENITSMIAVDDKIFCAHGSGYKYYDTTDGTTTTVAATPSTLFLLGGYYLWRSYQNDLYYTSDLSTWTQLDDPAGPDAYEIRGMAVMDRQLYAATDAGLYTVMPGDFVEQVTAWSTIDDRNGIGMAEWQGALYIPLAEDMIRYSVDGSIMQVGLRTGEELPANIQGTVYRLHPTNYFLLASMSHSQEGGQGSLWAYSGSGWHNIAQAPPAVKGGALLIDTATNSPDEPGFLYWGGSYGMIMRLNYPANVINPVRDIGSSQFARVGWMEFDRFYGKHVALDKDFESVYYDTEDITEGTVSIYWQDEDSTDWELLGSSTAASAELRWTLAAGTRPKSKWLKLGILLRTENEIYTPIVRAHRLKFNALITDRWRWQLVVVIDGPKQQLVDGTINTYTTAQQKTHIESLIRGVEPFILQDVDSTQYEVRAIGGARRLQQYEWVNGAALIKYIYDFQVEATTGTAL